MTDSHPLLSVQGLSIDYRTPRGMLRAVTDVSFDIAAGETLGLVGESGSGKSSIGRAILGLLEHYAARYSGTIAFAGERIDRLTRDRMRAYRRQVQMIFQDPVASLNPRRRIGDLVEEALIVSGRGTAADRRDTVRTVLRDVGLDPDITAERYPHQMSGGQCQRVSIARALAVQPRLIVCDEAVSALDVSVQAQILNLLEDLKAKYNLALLFISHDLAVVKNISDRIAVMYLGRICEIATSESLVRAPKHPYTRALLSAVPDLDSASMAKRIRLAGDPPSPFDPPTGCPFNTRCQTAVSACHEMFPPRKQFGGDHVVHCHAAS